MSEKTPSQVTALCVATINALAYAESLNVDSQRLSQYSKAAAGANAGDLRAQIEYLICQYGEMETRRLIAASKQ